MHTKKEKFEVYFNFFIIITAVELFNYFVTRQGIIEFYARDAIFPWAFPIRVILPLWTLLYLFMAVSGARLWLRPSSHIRTMALSFWTAQLVFNILWPLCFYQFSFQVLTPIIISIVFISLLLLLFYSFLIDKIASYFMVPYFLMVIYKMIFHWTLYILKINVY